MRVLLSISPLFARKVALLLTLVVLGFVFLSVGGLLAVRALEGSPLQGAATEFYNAFNANREKSFPNLYSAYALLLCSFLLGLISLARRTDGARYVAHWALLGVVFLYLSVDEALVIHEKLISPLQSALGTDGFLRNAWVIPGAVAVLVLGLAYLRFVLDLPAGIRSLFVIAGAVYVGGALGMEMVDGYYQSVFGDTLGQELLTNTEEALEMLGVVVFVYALLMYLSLRAEKIEVMPDPPAGGPRGGSGTG
ncbi:hypothetical protein GBA63_11240 [Rubrobacter tropicus]|uniref:Uncharacterized protein n=1 Tax=Rubrobacter tropicus TaxID=2653851 RepID=A0A6G8Q9N5_9ACTN|nr:hypothetical protein [Rubrobacter tropicus]QIN83153.1 hypothetical protein GBA63_11240 [Rubrobacter tropicus]